jgi:hypothetical protein
MSKPIDLLGMGPARTEEKLPSGNFLVTVTPPAWTGIPRGKSIELSANQYLRYLSWRKTGVLIQNALPELSPSQREILMTGT